MVNILIKTNVHYSCCCWCNQWLETWRVTKTN